MDPKASQTASTLAAVARASTEAAAQPSAAQADPAIQAAPAGAQPVAVQTQPVAAAQPVAIQAQPAAVDASQAILAAKQRIAAIIGLPEAKGREAMAQELALNTDLSVDQAKTLLSKSPEAKQSGGFEAAMRAAPNPNLGTDVPAGAGSDQTVAMSWADSIGKANKRFGVSPSSRH